MKFYTIYYRTQRMYNIKEKLMLIFLWLSHITPRFINTILENSQKYIFIYVYIKLSEILLDLLFKLCYMSTVSDQIKEQCHTTILVNLFFSICFSEF